MLTAVAVGPIDYPMQPSVTVLVLVAAGSALFIAASQAGDWCFGRWAAQRPNWRAPPKRVISVTVMATALLGLAGIGMMAFDRTILSGAGDGGYAELLRCAPDLAGFIEVKRTVLLYLGYLSFSFGFVSLVLFILRGEEIRGAAAILAQLSILSPVGYALLYSGRMPILFVIVLIVGAALVRVGQGRRPLPGGHHLLIKMAVVFLLFAVYSSSMWATRQAFCLQMSGLIQELQHRMKERDAAAVSPSRSKPAQPNLSQPNQPGQPAAPDQSSRPALAPSPSADSISAADLRKRVDETKVAQPPARESADAVALLATMQEAWHVTPRGYVLWAIDSGRLSPNAAMNLLSTYFYLTHGTRILDLTWHARAQFSPHWGVYEIGILSPILRIFFPQADSLASMSAQLKSAEIYGFFPTAWAAAFIDFGLAGAVIYILIWGFAAGWSNAGAKRSQLVMPALLLTFIVASVLLSPIQGALGVANSALVLVSMLIAGMAADLCSLRDGPGRPHREPVGSKPGAT